MAPSRSVSLLPPVKILCVVGRRVLLPVPGQVACRRTSEITTLGAQSRLEAQGP